MQSKRREDTRFGSLYPRLQYAAFPDAILALEHVLTSIDELLMTPEEAAVCAARSAQVERLQQMLGRIRFGKERLARNFLEVAAEYGHCNVIDVVYDYWGHHLLLVNTSDKALEVAIRHGHLNAVKCLLPRFNCSLKEPLKHALESKQQEILELLCHEASSYELCWAAKEGHLPIVQLIYSRMNDGYIYQALTEAARGGYLHVIEFLFHVHDWHLYETHHVYDYGSAIVIAAKQDHGDIVQFLVSNHGFVRRIEVYDAFSAAAARDHWNVVELLYAQKASQPCLLDEVFLSAATRGDMKSIKVLFQLGENSPPLLEESPGTVENQQRPEAVKRLSLHGIDGSVFSKAVSNAAASGNVNTVNCLHQIGGKTGAKLFDDGFVKAASVGCLEIVVFLFDEVTERAIRNSAFVKAAEGKKWRVIKFLVRNAVIDKALVEEIFMRAVANGDRKIVVWLCNYRVIRTSVLERGLLVAAERGHQKILGFLYSHGVRSLAVLARASKKAARHCHFNIVGILGQWKQRKRWVHKKKKH